MTRSIGDPEMVKLVGGPISLSVIFLRDGVTTLRLNIPEKKPDAFCGCPAFAHYRRLPGIDPPVFLWDGWRP